MSYEKDKLDTFVTSASLSSALTVALAPYVTSASVSSAIAGINLAPYVTSNSLSAAVTTQALTVGGAASVSATLSAGAVTLAGRPVGMVLLGYSAGTAFSSAAFSGSWSDYCSLVMRVAQKGVGAGTPTVSVFKDGGTSAIMSVAPAVDVGATVSSVYEITVFGNGDGPTSILNVVAWQSTNLTDLRVTSTANSAVINCIKVALTATASVGYAMLYGWRKT